MKRLAFRFGVLGFIAMGSAAGLAVPGCEHAQCDELHDPTCWIPPITDAAGDGDDGDDDAPAERDAVTEVLTAAGDGSTAAQ